MEKRILLFTDYHRLRSLPHKGVIAAVRLNDDWQYRTGHASPR